MLISNYGLFWRADNVFWGWQNNDGRLLGVPANNLRAEQVDFGERTGIYVLYSDYDIIYIGQTGNADQKLLKRLRQHRRDPLADRWNQFSWFGLRQVLITRKLKKERMTAMKSRTADVLNHIEAILIYAAEPRLNRQGGRFGENVEQFLQRRDDKLKPEAC